MKVFMREEGFTLVEILVALSILTIIIFAFTTLYTTSFANIYIAGGKSVELYHAQTEIDQVIDQGAASGSADELHIIFGSMEITVEGEAVEVDYEHEGRSGTLLYFLPGN